MSLLKPKPHDEISLAFVAHLPLFVSIPNGDGMRQAHTGSDQDAPTLEDLAPAGERILPTDAQQVFVLRLIDVANNPGKAIASAGWRFFAGNKPGKMLMGTVSRRLPSQGWIMTGGFFGDRVSELLQASNALDELEEVRKADFELRVLNVPGLNIQAFWLVAMAENDDDLVVRFIPGQNGKEAGLGPVSTMAHFLAEIRPMAQLRLTAEARHGS